MIPPIFDLTSSQKDIIIILHQYTYLSINYLYLDNYDIYIISNLNIFEKYLKKELSQNTHRKVTIISILSDINVLVEMIIFLNSFENNEGRLQSKKQFAEEYAYYLREMQYGDDKSGYEFNDSELNFPPGHCDTPLPFELIVVLDNADLKNDHLSPRSVFLQQLLRFVSLKHGGIFVCTSNTKVLITSEKAISSFLQQIGHKNTNSQRMQPTRPDPIAIYESGLNLDSGNLQIRLLSPKGWDSWNKIQILTSSVIHEKDSSKYYILEGENEFHKLNLVYNSYIDSIYNYVEGDTTEEQSAEEHKKELLSLLFTDYNASKTTHDIQKDQGITLEEVLSNLQTES